MGKPASSSACRSRRTVRVVTPESPASSSTVNPSPRERSSSRSIVHWRMTSAFRGTGVILAIAELQDGRIAGRKGTVAGREGTVAGREGTVAGREGTVAGREGTVAGREGTVAGR